MINKFSILNGAKYFSLGIFQSYLVFITLNILVALVAFNLGDLTKYQKKVFENTTKSNSNFSLTFVDFYISILKKVINLYISYTLGPKFKNLNTDFTLGNCLFGSVKLTKNDDLEKYKYSGHGIGFDSRSEFSLLDGTMEKNAIIFGADMSSYVHVDNKGKNTLILGEGPMQGLDDTTLTAEAKYIINFAQSAKIFQLSLMSTLFKKIFTGLLTCLVNGSNDTKCISLSNHKSMIQPTLNNLHSSE